MEFGHYLFYMAPPFCFLLIFVSHRPQCGATFMDSPFNACGMHAIITGDNNSLSD